VRKLWVSGLLEWGLKWMLCYFSFMASGESAPGCRTCAWGPLRCEILGRVFVGLMRTGGCRGKAYVLCMSSEPRCLTVSLGSCVVIYKMQDFVTTVSAARRRGL
jgi:hypothetical protein